jgi:hypothetical protein
VREILASRPRFVVATPASIAADESPAAAVLRDALRRDYAPAAGRNGGPANLYERTD